jgi:23S rRNA pseudouridine1911/1915/1917 synthase
MMVEPGPDNLQVLYEDNHLLAVVKPVGLATMGVAADRPSLLAIAKQYVKQRYQKPGNVYLGIVSRLDASVSGVVLLARTSKAAARLNEQFRTREVEKIYWGVVEGLPEDGPQALRHWLAPDERHRRMHVVGPTVAGAQEARLSFHRLAALPGGSTALVEITLETGRKHQIRLQLAEHGFPILGDRKYGGRRRFAAGIALHARRLAFRHPVRDEAIELIAPLPATWRSLGVRE